MSPTSTAHQPPKRETVGLLDAVECWVNTDKLLHQLDHLERASARMILDKLDAVMEPGEDRQAFRRRLLDTLAWYKAEMLQWVESQSKAKYPNSPVTLAHFGSGSNQPNSPGDRAKNS
jgi:hypothetical protein